jgi:type II secretory pathway pseudopilin PulG
MEIKSQWARDAGLTRIECLVVLGVLGLISFFLLLPMSYGKSKARAQRINCVNNLKNIGLITRQFATEHGEEFPWQIPSSKGGAQEAAATGNLVPIFQLLTNGLVAKNLNCASDAQHSRTSDMSTITASNISYFICTEAREDEPFDLMTGDRNITGAAVVNRIMSLPLSKTAAGWDRKLHNAVGNIGLADGSVQQTTPASLNSQLQRMATNGINEIHLLIP